MQIRSVGALPALVDEHWDAARSFLYNGDFQRWLRDINRHDLVVAADEIIKEEPNHDAGLEHFVRVVDPGLPKPVVTVDPPAINLGSIARSALIRRVTILNTARLLAGGYRPPTWIGCFRRPQPVGINPRRCTCRCAPGSPFRSRQHGEVTSGLRPGPHRHPRHGQVSLTQRCGASSVAPAGYHP